jgi:hypothetical protein
VQIESVTANRIAEFSTSKDAACAANFQPNDIFSFAAEEDFEEGATY